MTDPPAQDYSNEQDLPPDTIVELRSIEEEEPIQLEGGSSDPETWPKPLEGWEIEAHEDEYRDDPDVAIGEDNTQDWPPEKLSALETPL